MSKKFSRNFACQNNFRFFEKRQPLKRNHVEKIQLNFFLSKKVNYRQETVSKKFNRNFACRNNSLEFARILVENIPVPILCSKLLCRNYSAKELRNVGFLTMSKLFLS